MPFDPKTDKYPYPEYTDQHYLKIKKDNGAVFDRHYPFHDRSNAFRFRQFWVRVLLNLVVFPLARIRLGLRIKGRKNLKKHGDVLRRGVLSCSNHVHMWDYICVMRAVRPARTNVLVWAPNVRGENGKLVRLVGGIPIPEDDAHGSIACMKAVEEVLNGGWLHVYAEGSMWEYYAPIRPFKSGIGVFACRFDKPVLPMAFSYRRPNWLRRTVFRQIACLTMTVGEPIFADPPLPKKEREADLIKRCHAAVCRLAGMDPAENVYPPLFDRNKRAETAVPASCGKEENAKSATEKEVVCEK